MLLSGAEALALLDIARALKGSRRILVAATVATQGKKSVQVGGFHSNLTWWREKGCIKRYFRNAKWLCLNHNRHVTALSQQFIRVPLLDRLVFYFHAQSSVKSIHVWLGGVSTALTPMRRVRLLDVLAEEHGRILIFVNTARAANELAAFLHSKQIACAAFHKVPSLYTSSSCNSFLRSVFSQQKEWSVWGSFLRMKSKF